MFLGGVVFIGCSCYDSKVRKGIRYCNVGLELYLPQGYERSWRRGLGRVLNIKCLRLGHFNVG